MIIILIECFFILPFHRDQWKNYEDNYQPVFTDGWAPEYPHFPEEIGPELAARRRPEVEHSFQE